MLIVPVGLRETRPNPAAGSSRRREIRRACGRRHIHPSIAIHCQPCPSLQWTCSCRMRIYIVGATHRSARSGTGTLFASQSFPQGRCVCSCAACATPIHAEAACPLLLITHLLRHPRTGLLPHPSGNCHSSLSEIQIIRGDTELRQKFLELRIRHRMLSM